MNRCVRLENSQRCCVKTSHVSAAVAAVVAVAALVKNTRVRNLQAKLATFRWEKVLLLMMIFGGSSGLRPILSWKYS